MKSFVMGGSQISTLILTVISSRLDILFLISEVLKGQEKNKELRKKKRG